MHPLNGYLCISPIKRGVIASEGNEYKIIGISNENVIPIYDIGEKIVVEDQFVIRVVVDGSECFFVKEENVLARIDGSSPNDQCRAKV